MEMDGKKLITSTWGPAHDVNNTRFSQEASTLDYLKELGLRNICPSCFGNFFKKDMVKVIKQYEGTEDEETAGWEFKCPTCKSTLTVWND